MEDTLHALDNHGAPSSHAWNCSELVIAVWCHNGQDIVATTLRKEGVKTWLSEIDLDEISAIEVV